MAKTGKKVRKLREQIRYIYIYSYYSAFKREDKTFLGPLFIETSPGLWLAMSPFPFDELFRAFKHEVQ